MKPLKLTIILLLCSISNIIIGQDYQTINSNRIAYFDNQFWKNIECIRIDSIKNQRDSILYPFCVIQNVSSYCFSPYVASWIGKNVTIKENGQNEFINKVGDTITINTNAVLGEKWIAFNNASLTIEATVKFHDTLTFLGINDSVKTIEFQSYDKNMDSVNLRLNDMQVQISKNYGFVKIFNFYLFPNFKVAYPFRKILEYDLIGLSNPKVGVQNLTWFDVHDFQIGDELHILNEVTSGKNNLVVTDKAIYKYLKRTDYSDSIVYLYSRKQSIFSTWSPNNSSFEYYDDTLRTTIKPNSIFDKLSGEPIVSDSKAYNYYMTNGSPPTKTNYRKTVSFGFVGDSCWETNIPEDGCDTQENTFVKGLGGPYYSCSQHFSLGDVSKQLVYYKKGETIRGNPLIVTGISEIEAVNKIMVYPNPTNGYLNISIEGNTHSDIFIHFYDIQGRYQKTENLGSNNTKVDISDLSTGIYILKITDNGTILKMDRLIIE